MTPFYSVVVSSGDMTYLRDLIPKLDLLCDKIVMVIDEPIEGLDKLSDKLLIKYKKYEYDLSAMRNYGLQFVPIGSWYMRIDDDESPSNHLIENGKRLLSECDHMGVDRILVHIFHLSGERACKEVVGLELRIMKRTPDLKYLDKTHERVDARFPGKSVTVGYRPSLVHFKFMDKIKLKETEERYIPNGMYADWDWENRKLYGDVELPHEVEYTMTDELRERLLCVAH